MFYILALILTKTYNMKTKELLKIMILMDKFNLSKKQAINKIITI
tara:strand:- start:441 stop:575 length:135 start_codon:yes stop_codon:yes gene_type:complete